MREIKFRLYDKDRNLTTIFSLSELISKTFRRGKFQFRGRSTGLKDKNGKEIYEGDIVRIKMFRAIEDWEYENVTVVWQDDKMRFGLISVESPLKDSWAFTPSNDFEIIGNIY